MSPLDYLDAIHPWASIFVVLALGVGALAVLPWTDKQIDETHSAFQALAGALRSWLGR